MYGGFDYLIKFHEFMAIHFFSLIEWDEFDIFWLGCFVCERSFDL
jgi:hypothetical protein